jgi:hypothetical protein
VTILEPEILEPGRLGNVEMIDRMEVVIETGRGRLFGHQAAAVFEAAVDQQNVQARFGEVAAENEAVMPRTDDDAVVALFQRLGHAVPPEDFSKVEGTLKFPV